MNNINNCIFETVIRIQNLILFVNFQEKEFYANMILDF